ncbi:unnamed protein product [Parajaminaea phylloscopi]
MVAQSKPSLASERLTLTYATRGDLPLCVDVYPFALPVVTASTGSSFPLLAPFVLFLHSSPKNPFFSGFRRLIPQWLLAICRDRGWPLVSPDYRLAPEADLSDSWTDLQSLWDFLADEGGLNWSIKSAGGGSEADTGSSMLNDGFQALQHRGGLDASKCCVVATGGAAYLAALGAALLRPAPLALVLLNPILDPSASFYAAPTSPAASATTVVKRRSKRLEGVLGRTGSKGQAIVCAIDVDGSTEHATGLRGWEPPWWRMKYSGRKAKAGHKEGKERSHLFATVLASGRLANVLQPPVHLQRLLTTSRAGTNVPYPPVFSLAGERDASIDPCGPTAFLDCLRSCDPAAAALDSLLSRSIAHQSGQGPCDTHRKPAANSDAELFEPLHRFIHRTVPNAQHGFDAFALRDDHRYVGEFDAIEAFLANWFELAQLRPQRLYANKGAERL